MTSNVLIITESMMPFTSYWGSCQRVYHYAKKMVAEGMNVTVLCHNVAERTDGTELVDGIKVIGIGGVKSSKTTVVKTNSGTCGSLYEKLKRIDRNLKTVSRVVRGFYRFVYSEPNVMYGRRGKKWASAVMPIALRYIKTESIDAVVLSGPSFGTFYYADQIKHLGPKLILDYRDPWVLWYEKPSLAERAEKDAVRMADLVVTTTNTLTEELTRKYNTSKCHTVMNGYDKELWNSIPVLKLNSEKLTISYVGNITVDGDAIRNPNCFISAAKEFAGLHRDVHIQFVGVKDKLDSINPEYKKFIEFRNTVSVAESLKITVNSDVLLVFHTAIDSSGKYIICGKIFDCIRSGNYILSIGNKAYANKDIIEKTASGIHCDNNKDAILNTLEEIYSKWKDNKLSSQYKDIEKYSRDYQNMQFIELMLNC